jgi:hypothetical protein
MSDHHDPESTMATNLSPYEADLTRLVDEGNLLLYSMRYEQFKDEFTSQMKRALEDKAEEFIKKLPRFSAAYQNWYSEAVAVISQIIPHRLSDFVRHYERQPNRKSIRSDNYTIEDYLQGLSITNSVPMYAAVPRMEQQVNILKSAQQRFKSSLFDIRQLMAADLFDSEVESARALVKSKFLRAAGAVAGVVMEKHLTQVCDNHKLKVTKKNPTIGDLNNLLKDADVIDTPRWRANQHLADIRNLCDHNKTKEPTQEQVLDLVDGVAKVLKTIV